MADRQAESTPDAPGDRKPLFPAEVEVYVEPDGSVTFADLADGLRPVARRLDRAASRSAGRESGSPSVGDTAVDASP
jgi:hypothetical protein